ncbi:MAG: DUF4810 domain-containing protein [Pseudomonadales bacterium]
MSHKAIIATAICTLFLTGCAGNKPLYHWGSYQQLVLDSYTAPGKADAATQIEKLTTDIQQARDSGQNIAPGVHAQLGLMYAEQGQAASSLASFEQEKRLFPESTQFINGLINRANTTGTAQ